MLLADRRRPARAGLGHRPARRAAVRRHRLGVAIFWGFVLVAVVLGVLAFVGRRRQQRARAKAAEQRASAFRGVRDLTSRGARALQQV